MYLTREAVSVTIQYDTLGDETKCGKKQTKKRHPNFPSVIDTCSVNTMQIATVLICASCERVVVTIGKGSWKRVVDESHSLELVMFTTVVLCWQCGQTQSTCPVRGVGSIMTAQLFADSPALDTVA